MKSLKLKYLPIILTIVLIVGFTVIYCFKSEVFTAYL